MAVVRGSHEGRVPVLICAVQVESRASALGFELRLKVGLDEMQVNVRENLGVKQHIFEHLQVSFFTRHEHVVLQIRLRGLSHHLL